MARKQTIGAIVRATDKWREQYNPLRGLTITRAISLLESFNRGEMTELQWTYKHLEEGDETVFALLERRASALLELDWSIKMVPDDQLPKGVSPALVEEQRDFLREAYDRIDNLSEACEFIALATFRGYSHLQKHTNETGEIHHLEPLDQWNWVRDGMFGEWFYNRKAQNVTADALRNQPDTRIDPAQFIIRARGRHVNRIALTSYIRKNLGEKDWTAFVEIYGIPGGVVGMPPNVPADALSEYLDLAREVAAGGNGVIPYGGTYTANDGPRGVNPFQEFIRHQQEKIVLCGTGGLLTMLTESGSGTLAGGAHEETFAKIAKAEARIISEVFQQQFDKHLLEAEFPGQPVLAYWELAANEEADLTETVDHAQKLSTAGYQIDLEQLSEKTGYNLEIKEVPEFREPGGTPGGARETRALPMRNRDTLQNLRRAFAAGVREDLKPVAARLQAIEAMVDGPGKVAALEALLTELPALQEEINQLPKSADPLIDALAAGLKAGLSAQRAGGKK